MLDTLFVIFYFIRARWLRNYKSQRKLHLWQEKQLRRFFRKTLIKASYFKGRCPTILQDLPYMDKAKMMENFAEFNTRGITFKQATALATKAEESRNFNPTIGDITVGLSSGTSGKRGLFLVSKQERLQWAGILLAKTLPNFLLKHILSPWLKPLRIAFFLRANSNLYSTLKSRRIDFQFYDLLIGLDAAVPQLMQSLPDVLVAPATVLRHLALAKLNGDINIHPLHIVSVAEVLEAVDSELIEQAFGLRPHQIYQATEGFLGYTCECGGLHLNEAHVHIEHDWLDKDKKRFQPIITDFSRTTQLIVRYKLNDILQVAEEPCPCGKAEMTLSAIEGRADEILWLPSLSTGKLQPLYPDILRRCMMLVEPNLVEYSIEQTGQIWVVNFSSVGESTLVEMAITKSISDLCKLQGLVPPSCIFDTWMPALVGAKRRRMVCKTL